MSTCAVMLVKDEADIVEPVLRHLAGSVDQILVSDNCSTDGTYELLLDLRAVLGDALVVGRDLEPGYYQSRKTTALAMQALELGHSWVVPCDADEVWYAPDGRRLADFLAGLAPDVQFVQALLFDHVASALDPPVSNPLEQIGWRKIHHGQLPKVACRLRPDLVIEAGNHSARTSGTGLLAGGLGIEHFSWRSAGQYVRKIRNGERAYAATDLAEGFGRHWRMWAGKPDEAIADHFRVWFWSLDPEADDSLTYAPVTPLLLG